MSLTFYPALLYADAGLIGAVFPDLPGCVSDGATVQEAATAAAEALALHLEGMVEAKLALPEPSAPDAAPPRWLAKHGRPLARVLVPVDMPGVRVRTNITIDQGLLARLDTVAAEQGYTRSGFIAEAVRQRLGRAA